MDTQHLAALVRTDIAETAAAHGFRCAARLALAATTRDEWFDVANDLFFGSVHLANGARQRCASAAQAAQLLGMEQHVLAAQTLGLEGTG